MDCRLNFLQSTDSAATGPERVKFHLQMSKLLSSQSGFSVRIMGTQGSLTAKPDQPLLLSALAAGHVLPGSCRNGVCRTCICRLHSGSITYRMEWPGLSAEEKTEGLFLPCVAYPASDLVMSVGEA